HDGRGRGRALGSGRARGAGGEPDGGGDEGRRNHCRDVAAVAHSGEGGGQPQLRDIARRGRALRAARLPRLVRDQGPQGRHGRLHREAPAAVEEWRGVRARSGGGGGVWPVVGGGRAAVFADEGGEGGGTQSVLGGGELEPSPRHIVLHEIGGPGQQALKRARVLVIGAG